MLTIKQGANFRGGLSYLGMFTAVLCLFILIFSFSFDTTLDAILTLVVLFHLVLGVNLFLGFEGVQIDLLNRRIREYRSFMGLRTGAWLPLDDFDTVLLHTDRFTISTMNLNAGPTPNRHVTFDVRIVGENNAEGILLYECFSYDSGHHQLLECAANLDMPYRDTCAEDMQKSLERRRARGRRR